MEELSVFDYLERLSSEDSDVRMSAVQNLSEGVAKGLLIFDDEYQIQVIYRVLALLEDQKIQIKNEAVKCLAAFVKKFPPREVESVLTILSTNVISNFRRLRDISIHTLKLIFSELPQAFSLPEHICEIISDVLDTAVYNNQDVSFQMEALDILIDLLTRFSTVLERFHDVVLEILIAQLPSPNESVRTRTIKACSKFVLNCNTFLYNELLRFLHQKLCSEESGAYVLTYIECTIAVCNEHEHRFEDHLETFVPLILNYLDGVRDYRIQQLCLETCETFITKCPRAIYSQIFSIRELCLKYMKYGAKYDEYDIQSDNHISWKVRRSAVKCLVAIILTCHDDHLQELYEVLSPALIEGFKERNQYVHGDIFHAHMVILEKIKSAMTRDNRYAFSIVPNQDQIEILITGVQDELYTTNIKVKESCVDLLQELCKTFPGVVSKHLETIIGCITNCITETNADRSLKTKALSFIYFLLDIYDAQYFYPFVDILMPEILSAVKHKFYKVAAEALRILKQLVKVIRPIYHDYGLNFTPLVKDVYACTFDRFMSVRIDQDIKESAISTMGEIISSLGDYLVAELPGCLPIFLARLKNDVTALVTIQALTQIASGPINIELPILPDVMLILGSFLRKSNTVLVLNTLQLINSLINNYRILFALQEDLLQQIIVEIPQLLDNCSIEIPQWAFIILKACAEHYPQVLLINLDTLMPQVLSVLISPCLQDTVLHYILEFFKALILCNFPDVSYTTLSNQLSVLVTTIATNSDRFVYEQPFHSLAKCMAVMLVTAVSQSPLPLPIPLISPFISEIHSAPMVFQKVFLLLCVGEVGRLSSSLVPRFEDIFILFSHASEEVKVAASWAVAGICIGNLSDCLPFIVQQSQTPSAIQLWLLISLNKVMTYFGQSIDRSQQFLPYVSLVWEELIKHSGSDEDGIRDSVTEGLSKLTLIDPTNCLPKLKLLLDSPSPIIRFTAMAAFHLTISDQPSTIDPLLREWIEDFLVALRDSDVRVRRAAIVTFNSAVYNKPVLVTHLLDSILPDIYKETVVQDDLITIIEQGSLRLIFDNGLDTRKAAYECLYTVLDCLSNKLDLFDFMKHIIRGLGDQRDVKIFTFNLIEKLTLVCPRLVSQTTDLFIEPLNKIFSLELPIGAPNEDQEQITEIKTFALRVIISLLNMPNAEKNPHLVRLVRQIKATDYWLTIFEAVQTVFEIPESMTNMINKI